MEFMRIQSDIMNNPKISVIRSRDDGDSLFVIWIGLLALAAHEDSPDGSLMLSKTRPHDSKTLAIALRKRDDEVAAALELFESLDMVVRDDGVTWRVTNYVTYQDTKIAEAKAEKRRKSNERQRRHREKVKQEQALRERDSDTAVTQCHAGDKTREDIDTDKKEINKEKSVTESRHHHGTYGKVMLTDSELERLRKEFPSDWEKRIERLDEYIASTGKRYKSHLATIRSWARRDAERASAKAPGGYVDDVWAAAPAEGGAS